MWTITAQSACSTMHAIPAFDSLDIGIGVFQIQLPCLLVCRARIVCGMVRQCPACTTPASPSSLASSLSAISSSWPLCFKSQANFPCLRVPEDGVAPFLRAYLSLMPFTVFPCYSSPGMHSAVATRGTTRQANDSCALTVMDLHMLNSACKAVAAQCSSKHFKAADNYQLFKIFIH